MNIVFITPAARIRRYGFYRLGSSAYGQTNSITGPLILGGILRRAGHHVEVYEELNAAVDIKKMLPRTDIFCFTIMTSTADRGYELADYVHAHSHARVLIGGFHASAMPEEAAEHADQVLVGEGEAVILDVVEGRITDRIVRAKPIEDLDTVPFPDYSILKTPCKAANVISTRGCPFRCTFCTTSRMFAPYRKRSVDNVMKEIRMYKRMGFQYMNFEDDNFTADKERAKEICRRMIAEHLQFKETFFFGRTDMAKDEELLTLLHDAHLTRVLIGIESLNQKALDSVNKRQNIEDIRRAGIACRKHGIRMIASIVLGLDEDSIRDMNRAVAFAKSIDAYQLQPAILTPYPGTPVWNQMVKESRLLPVSYEAYDMMNVVFQPKQESPWELQEEFYRAVRYFYSISSAARIGKLFGREYGWRRFFLAIGAKAGSAAAEFCSKYVPKTIYYEIRHLPWIYASDPRPARHPKHWKSRTA